MHDSTLMDANGVADIKDEIIDKIMVFKVSGFINYTIATPQADKHENSHFLFGSAVFTRYKSQQIVESQLPCHLQGKDRQGDG